MRVGPVHPRASRVRVTPAVFVVDPSAAVSDGPARGVVGAPPGRAFGGDVAADRRPAGEFLPSFLVLLTTDLAVAHSGPKAAGEFRARGPNTVAIHPMCEFVRSRCTRPARARLLAVFFIFQALVTGRSIKLKAGGPSILTAARSARVLCSRSWRRRPHVHARVMMELFRGAHKCI
jgi:hypothetical protein